MKDVSVFWLRLQAHRARLDNWPMKGDAWDAFADVQEVCRRKGISIRTYRGAGTLVGVYGDGIARHGLTLVEACGRFLEASPTPKETV